MIYLLAAGLIVVGVATLAVITMSLGNPNLGTLAEYASRYYPLATLAGILLGFILAIWLLKEHHEKWAWAMLALPFITGLGAVLVVRYGHPGVLAPRETNERNIASIQFPANTSDSSSSAEASSVPLDFQEVLGDRLTLRIPNGLKLLDLAPELKAEAAETLKRGGTASLWSWGTEGLWGSSSKIFLSAYRGQKEDLERLMGSSTHPESLSKTQRSPSGTVEILKADGPKVHYLVARYGKTGTAWILLWIGSIDDWNRDSPDAARLRDSFEQSLKS